MTKLAILLLVFPLFATAKPLFSCEGESTVMNPGAKLHFKMFEDPSGKVAGNANGNPIMDSVRVHEASLKNLSGFLKCEPYDDKCLESHSYKTDGSYQMSAVVDIARNMAKIPGAPIRQNSLGTMNLSAIDHGRVYEIGGTSAMGPFGVYEYYDRNNKLLGRYIYAAEVMDCTDKATPSSLNSFLGSTSKGTQSQPESTDPEAYE